MDFFLFQSKFEAISSTPTPDGNLNYVDLLDETEKVCLYSSVNFSVYVCKINVAVN